MGGRARPRIGGSGPFGRTMRPVGSEYESKGGDVMVKVAEWPSRPGSKDNWVLKHRLAWERANGRPVPDGHVVAFKDRDRRNFDPGNLACLPRATMRVMVSLASGDPLLSWHDAETFDAVRAVAELTVAARRAEQTGPRRCGVCGREFRPDTFESGGTVVAKNRRTCRACLDAGRVARDA